MSEQDEWAEFVKAAMRHGFTNAQALDTGLTQLAHEIGTLKTRAALADEMRHMDEFIEAVEYDNEGCAIAACVHFASRYDALAGKGRKETRDG